MKKPAILVFIILCTASLHMVAHTKTETFTYWGDYAGVLSNQGLYPSSKRCVAEVIYMGNQGYLLNFIEEFNSRGKKIATAKGLESNHMVIFKNDSVYGIIKDDFLKGSLLHEGKWIAFQLNKVERTSPTLGAPPNKEAIVLFDGSDLNEWSGLKDQPLKWKITEENTMELVPRPFREAPRTDIITKRHFSDFYLHLEFQLSLMADSTGQRRSNSGVVFNGISELQVLDSYGLDGDKYECGAIYGISPPRVNMCFPPLSWQTYDIVFHAPRYNKNGQRIQDGEITVYHNGVRIQNKLTLNRGPDELETGETVFPVHLRLQDHRNTLWYRNIWAIDLSNNPELPEFMQVLDQ